MTEQSATDPEPDEVDRLRSENDALRARLDRRVVVRRWASIVFAVLTALSVLVATIAVWAHETVFDTDQFMEVVEPALEDPAFYSAMSDFASDQALQALAIEDRVTTALAQLDAYLSEALIDAIDPDPRVLALLSRFERPSLTALAPPIVEALESRVVGTIDAFFTSEEFKARFPQIVRQVHEAAIALVRNDLAELPNVYIADGAVRLNLIPTITEALRRVLAEIRDFLPDVTLPEVVSDRVQEGREELAAALDAELPEDFGQVTIMTEESLSDVQQLASRVDRAVWFVVIVALLLAAVTLGISPNRRRAVIQLSIAVITGFVVATILIRNLSNAILDEISSPDGVQVARSLLGEVTSSLRSLIVVILVAAVLVAVVAYLAGRPAWLDRLRGRLSEVTASGDGASRVDQWVASRYDALRVAGVVVALAVVFLTGIALLPVLVVTAILGVYLAVLGAMRRRVEVEEHEPAE